VDADEVGREMFGRRCRLGLALWIQRREQPRFYQSEPPKDVINQSDAAKELARLVRLGMLTEERSEAERRVYYVRTENPLWRIIATTAEVINTADHPSQRGQR
jgi:hypothetical protein